MPDQIVFGTGGLHSPEVFRHAWQAGYRTFDTAVYYANDAELFAALEGEAGGRDARVIHKLQPYRVPEQFERIIRPRLGGRPLHTLLLHHPALFVLDARPATFLKRWRELEALVERGLVRRIGCSNAGAAFIDHLCRHAAVKPAVNQIEGHPWNYDADLVRECQERGVEVQCYSPLGSGRLPVLQSSTLQEIARGLGRTPAQVCLRWLIQKGVVPIVRTGDPRHMRDNLEALAFSLDEARMEQIDRMGRAARAWDDPVKRGCRSATFTAEKIRVANPVRFGLKSALHYLLVEMFLRRAARAARARLAAPATS
jgi:diketogulonate reductase-like aldo/keto reductase